MRITYLCICWIIKCFESCSVYAIMWENIVEPKRAQMTIIRHRKHVIRMPGNRGKNTDTHSYYLTLITLQWQQWLHVCASMLRYTYTACLVNIIPSESQSMKLAHLHRTSSIFLLAKLLLILAETSTNRTPKHELQSILILGGKSSNSGRYCSIQ